MKVRDRYAYETARLVLTAGAVIAGMAVLAVLVVTQTIRALVYGLRTRDAR